MGTNARFAVNEHGLICRKASIGGSFQVICPQIFHHAILYNGYYPFLAGHPGTPQMCEGLRCLFYWLHMAADVFAHVAQCASSRMIRASKKRQKCMQLFPPSDLLEFVAINILGPLTKTRQGNRFIVVMADRYHKLTRAIQCAKVRHSFRE